MMSLKPVSSSVVVESPGEYSAMSMPKVQAPQLPLPMTTPFSEAAIFDDDIFMASVDESIWSPIDDVSNDHSIRSSRLINLPGEKGVSRPDYVNGVGALPDSDALNLYYMHFHESHPILLPRKFLFKYLFEQYPPYLKNMMRLIGSQYKSKASIEVQQKAIDQELSSENSKSGYLVQSLLLSSILYHQNNKQEQAKQTIDTAVEIALDLGMHLEQFAADNGCGSRYLEECWRRTWWELYVVDGLLKLYAQLPPRRWNLEMGVLLPVDDHADLEMTVCMETWRGNGVMADCSLSGSAEVSYIKLLSRKSFCQKRNCLLIFCIQDRCGETDWQDSSTWQPRTRRRQ